MVGVRVMSDIQILPRQGQKERERERELELHDSTINVILVRAHFIVFAFHADRLQCVDFGLTRHKTNE